MCYFSPFMLDIENMMELTAFTSRKWNSKLILALVCILSVSVNQVNCKQLENVGNLIESFLGTEVDSGEKLGFQFQPAPAQQQQGRQNEEDGEDVEEVPPVTTIQQIQMAIPQVTNIVMSLTNLSSALNEYRNRTMTPDFFTQQGMNIVKFFQDIAMQVEVRENGSQLLVVKNVVPGATEMPIIMEAASTQPPAAPQQPPLQNFQVPPPSYIPGQILGAPPQVYPGAYLPGAVQANGYPIQAPVVQQLPSQQIYHPAQAPAVHYPPPQQVYHPPPPQQVYHPPPPQQVYHPPPPQPIYHPPPAPVAQQLPPQQVYHPPQAPYYQPQYAPQHSPPPPPPPPPAPHHPPSPPQQQQQQPAYPHVPSNSASNLNNNHNNRPPSNLDASSSTQVANGESDKPLNIYINFNTKPDEDKGSLSKFVQKHPEEFLSQLLQNINSAVNHISGKPIGGQNGEGPGASLSAVLASAVAYPGGGSNSNKNEESSTEAFMQRFPANHNIGKPQMSYSPNSAIGGSNPNTASSLPSNLRPGKPVYWMNMYYPDGYVQQILIRTDENSTITPTTDLTTESLGNLTNVNSTTLRIEAEDKHEGNAE